MRKAYQSDLSDAEWTCLEPHLPIPNSHRTSLAPQPPRDPRRHLLRRRGGCAWRLLPHDFPPWKTVYHYFRFWRLDGTWERMHVALRKRVRVRLERNPQPSAAIVDSQSVKTTGVGGKERGYEAERRSRAGNAICSWTRKDWCLSAGSTARTSWIATASSSCWILPRRSPPSPLSPVAGRRLHRPRQGRRLGAEGPGMDGRDRAPPAQAGSGGGDEGMGKGVGQRGSGHRLGEVHAGERPQALLAEEMDSGADLLLVGTEQEDEQRLREAAGDRRSLHLRGDEPPDGEEIGSLMRVFRQFLDWTLAITLHSKPHQSAFP